MLMHSSISGQIDFSVPVVIYVHRDSGTWTYSWPLTTSWSLHLETEGRSNVKATGLALCLSRLEQEGKSCWKAVSW